MSEFILTLDDLGSQQQKNIETLFALSNGHLGIRASHPLKVGELYSGNPGTFMNGFYESHEIVYGEMAYAYAKNHQTMVKLSNLRGIVLKIEDEHSSEKEWSVQTESFSLNMKNGLLNESYLIETPNGKKLRLGMESFAFLGEEKTYCIRYVLNTLNFSGKINFLKDSGQFSQEKDDETFDSRTRDARTALDIQVGKRSLEVRTINSGLSFIAQQKTWIDEVEQVVKTPLVIEKTLDVQENIPVIIEQTTYFSSFKEAKEATFQTFDELKEKQLATYENFWDLSDIRLEENPTLQKGLRVNLFHLYQNAGRNGYTNFGAKGLTGEGYEGHYFWDTEMYLLPFFIFTQPEIAKSLLSYRISILPAAKRRAKEMSSKGALFAWRTINGEEASPYYPAGTAQVHINADIAYAFWLYEKASGDVDFIHKEAREVLYETARFWVSYGSFIHNRFEIHGVTGPDEYTAIVNNNYYTNKMAQHNLRYAALIAKQLGENSEEVAVWEKAADLMYLPFDEERALSKQDDSFLDKEIWDFGNTPSEKYPLLLHYHPLIIYKHQVCKQADTMISHMLFPGDVSKEQVQRDYDYYERVTTHDSSLSRAIYSVMASRINESKKAYDYFMDTAVMDLVDMQGNAADGIHAANMGGSWLGLIYGFAGLHYEEGWVLENHLPEEIEGLEFSLNLYGKKVMICLNNKKITAQSQDLQIETLSESKVRIRK